jgi:MoaA/NifB/PqqE/SkfB family radical SAM enzyme
MITFYPWSEKVLHECLQLHVDNKIATLDLELTAQCSKAHCIYCDSRPGVGKKEKSEIVYSKLEKIIIAAKEYGLKWVYTCGLGEPLEDDKFLKLLELFHKLHVRISLFTNGVLISKNIAQVLYKNDVGIILKLDTFNERHFDRILGKKGCARMIYKALDYLLEAGYGKGGGIYTNLAFSIVPTRINLDDIVAVIKFAKSNNIFPSIGELEHAGLTLKNNKYTELSLSLDETKNLQETVERLLWKNYKRPVCPTIITGMHIDHVGRCVVDKKTGLNCKWFLLKNPEIKIIGKVNSDNIYSMFNKMKKYRRECFKKNRDTIKKYSEIDYIFGGCGGNPSRIIKLAQEYL